MVHIKYMAQKTIETIKKMRKSNKTLCTWNNIVDKIVICDNVTTLNDMAVKKFTSDIYLFYTNKTFKLKNVRFDVHNYIQFITCTINSISLLHFNSITIL